MKLRDNANISSLVLGGCGFMGSHLVDGLLDRGYKVKIFDKSKVDTKKINHNISQIDLIRGNFDNKDDLRRAIKDIDYIFHFIGTTLPHSSIQNPIYDFESNVIATINMLEIAKSANVRKIIFASSGGTIYGIPKQIPISEDHPTNPICAYGITKLIIEKYLHLYYQLYGLDYISLRFSNAYGERQNPNGPQGAIAVFLGNIINGHPINIWGDGTAVRDYIYVRDIVLASLKAMENPAPQYRVLNIGSGIGLSLNELIAALKQTVGKEIQVQYTPGRKIDVPANVLDITLAQKVLQWKPQIMIEEGLRKTFQYLKNEKITDPHRNG
jgi:UDP-glucose 4-epimerase